MQKFVRNFLILIIPTVAIIYFISQFLIKNNTLEEQTKVAESEKPEQKVSQNLFAKQAMDSNAPMIAANANVKELPKKQLEDISMQFYKDFLDFYYAIIEDKFPEFSSKILSSNFRELCVERLQQRVVGLSKDHHIHQIDLARKSINYEELVFPSTKECMPIFYKTASQVLNAEELEKLKTINFFISAKDAQELLKNDNIIKIIRRINPNNPLLTKRFSGLFNSRKQPVAQPETEAQ